jgi:hypothetical protein
MIYENESLRQLIINYKSRELVPLTCSVCRKSFYRRKNEIQWALRKKPTSTITCSTFCGSQLRKTQIQKPCAYCGNPTSKTLSSITKVKNSFCSSSCAAKFNNANKKTGTRRSKLELWLEKELISLYPELEFQFNQRMMINSELDIYVPKVKVAFELNGIFHYEPIYGVDKLSTIQNNDNRKFQACLEQGIELCIIDTSNQSKFTEKSSQQFLFIIQHILEQKLLAMQRVSDSNG